MLVDEDCVADVLLEIFRNFFENVAEFSSEAVVQRWSLKKVFLKISQNSQENTFARVSPATLLKKRLWRRCFPVNFVEFLRTLFLYNTSGGCFCLLEIQCSVFYIWFELRFPESVLGYCTLS